MDILEELGPDIDREKWTLAKAIAIARLAFFRALGKGPVAHLEHAGLFLDELEKYERGAPSLLKKHRDGKAGVASFDFDKTLALKDGKDVDDLFLPMIKKLIDSGFSVMVLSNKVYDVHTRARYDRLVSLGVHIVTHIPAKPCGGAFERLIEMAAAARKTEVAPEELVHVGDNFFTDGGCLLLGIDFVQVQDVTQERLKAWREG